MTPLEKAKHVEYCDQCEQFVILNDAPYCKVDGKLIHPIMIVRGQGNGPALNCKKRRNKPQTNADSIRAMTDEELADWIELLLCPANCPDEQMGEACARTSCDGCWLSWLKSPVEVDE